MEEKTENSQSSSSETSLSCVSCHTPQTPDENRRRLVFPSTDGLSIHGLRPSDTPLTSWIRIMEASSVHRLFYAYSTIVQLETPRCFTTCRRFPDRNRFADIPCIEETRVHVKGIGPEDDYVHANHVDGFEQRQKFIVTQSPLAATRAHFWTLVWQQKSLLVVALTATSDSLLWPRKKGRSLPFAGLSITHLHTRCVRGVYEAALLEMTDGSSSRQVLFVQYLDWPATATPRQPSQILHLLVDVNYNYRLLRKLAAETWLPADVSSPIVVFDETGTGPAAALVALDVICEKMDASNERSKSAVVDVDGCVQRIRAQRAMAVQRPEQYVFVVLATVEWAIRRRFISREEATRINLHNYSIPDPAE